MAAELLKKDSKNNDFGYSWQTDWSQEFEVILYILEYFRVEYNMQFCAIFVLETLDCVAQKCPKLFKSLKDGDPPN